MTAPEHEGGLGGRRALVTGGSGGIGSAVALALRRRGARVQAGARRRRRLESLASAGIATRELDVTDAGSCERFVESAVESLGGIDIVVNAAGLALDRGHFSGSTEEDEERTIETNLRGLMRISRLCLGHLGPGAHIVNIGSVAGRSPYRGVAAYSASKYGVRGFTQALREDLVGSGVRVTLVDPGIVQTDFALVRHRGDRRAAEASYEGLEPLQADDVAECVVFVVSRPSHVNVDELVVRSGAQSVGRVVRAGPGGGGPSGASSPDA
jgi:3-hydroxy acid dehydrogenase / malonic semialdehyde reductase